MFTWLSDWDLCYQFELSVIMISCFTVFCTNREKVKGVLLAVFKHIRTWQPLWSHQLTSELNLFQASTSAFWVFLCYCCCCFQLDLTIFRQRVHYSSERSWMGYLFVVHHIYSNYACIKFIFCHCRYDSLLKVTISTCESQKVDVAK